ncbi:MAG: ChaN family lipoprotein [Burkholderiales bacterium]|nr:ChaN family lipoprotein [Burkholderiales bacterium]
MRRPFLTLAWLVLAGCAAPLAPPRDVAALLLGEQHDAPSHQRLHHDVVQTLADRGQLAGVVLEMVERGRSTAGLGAGAAEAEVQAALAWQKGWPWSAYGPMVMASVRAGVVVHGGNLPRDQMRNAMQDTTLDGLLPPAAMQAHQRSIRAGHCGMLPEARILPMARVQVARDRSMAETLTHAVVPGKTVVLVAGSGHVDPAIGVPQHLPRGLVVKPVMLPGEDTGKDYCAELKQQLAPKQP